MDCYEQLAHLQNGLSDMKKWAQESVAFYDTFVKEELHDSSDIFTCYYISGRTNTLKEVIIRINEIENPPDPTPFEP